MPRLQLESATDVFRLDDIMETGLGIEALAGATGLGLPGVSLQWLEGAGDGAVFRGKRVLPRDIDLPLHIEGRERAHLREIVDRLVIMLSDECTLRFVEDDGTDWSVAVHRSGGGDYAYGFDTTGEADLRLVLTLRAGDPFWVYSKSSSKTISNTGAGRGLLFSGGSLSQLRVASSQAIGTMTLENLGNASAYPTWTVKGPGRDFEATSPKGETFHWTGELEIGETLFIDTRLGTVVDNLGANRYAELAPAPRFWQIPPRISTATVSLQDTDTTNSSITCAWRPRNWMVI